MLPVVTSFDSPTFTHSVVGGYSCRVFTGDPPFPSHCVFTEAFVTVVVGRYLLPRYHLPRVVGGDCYRFPDFYVVRCLHLVVPTSHHVLHHVLVGYVVI